MAAAHATIPSVGFGVGRRHPRFLLNGRHRQRDGEIGNVHGYRIQERDVARGQIDFDQLTVALRHNRVGAVVQRIAYAD